jgi:fucose permease
VQSAGFAISQARKGGVPSAVSFTAFGSGLFAVLGIVTTLLGPVLPLLAVRWSVSAAEIGTLFSWQFVSSTVGTLLSGAVLAKRSFRVAVLLGVGLCLLGVLALVRADWMLGRYAVACYGFGLGVALPAINLAVAEANPLRRAGSVSFLNFAWGIGAIGGPVLLRIAHSLNLFLFVVSGLLAVWLIRTAFWPMPQKKTALPGGNQRQTTPWGFASLIAFSMFLLCGIENAVGGWAATLALPHFSNAFTAMNANIVFWTCFLASRALAPVALRSISEARLLLFSIVVAAAGVLSFLFASSSAPVLISCALAGAGIGPGFPLVIARLSGRIGAENPTCTICFAFAGFGAATLPPLVGLMGAKMHEPSYGLLLPLFGLVLLIPLAREIAGPRLPS